MTYTDILYRVEDGGPGVPLNRPDKLNAWRGEMDRDVRAAMHAAADDPAVKLIVLTGAGKGFCAGADMAMLQGTKSSGATRPEGVRTSSTREAWDPKSNPNFQKEYSWFPAVPKPI